MRRENALPLLKMFHTSPVLGLTFLVLLLCVVVSARTVARTKMRNDRFLLGFLGVLAIQEAHRILQDAGVIALPSRYWADVGSLMVALAFLVSVLLVRVQSWKHYSTKLKLRIWEAIAR
jgi:hypothetical protein